MDDDKINKIEARDVIAAVFRNKLIVIIISCLGVVGAYFGVQFQTRLYDASVKMHIKSVSQVVVDYYQGIGEGNVRGTQIEIVKSEPVLRRAIQALNLDRVPLDFEKNYCSPIKRFYIDYTVNKIKKEMNNLSEERKKEFLFNLAMDRLLGSLIIDIIPGTDIFTITIRDWDPDRAIEIANVISRSYTIVDQQQQLAELRQKFGEFHPTVMQLEQNINETTQRLSGKRLPDVEAIGTASVKIIEQGRSDYRPVGKPKMMLFAAIIGASIAIGLALAFGLDFISMTLKSLDDIITYLNMPIIGSVPGKKFLSGQRLFNDDRPDTIYTQFLDDLADQFYVFIKTQNLHSVSMTSINRGEGTTNIIANIAVRLSQQMSCRTLLIDANFTHPGQYKLFGCSIGPGFANILERHPVKIDTSNLNSAEVLNTGSYANSVDDLIMNFENNIYKIDANLAVLPSGKFSDNPALLINESAIKTILDHAGKKYDVILIDTASVRKHKYAEKLVLLTDGTTLIVSEGKVKRSIVQSIIGGLRKKNANFIGAILNNRTFPIPQIIYNRL